MDIKVIRTEEQHAKYLDEIHELMLSMPAVGSIEGDRLELLITVVESYENRVFPVELPDPVDAILFRMHEKGLKQVDLVPYLGTKSRVSEILSRKRPLTVPMIKALSIGLGISTDTLVGINESNQTKDSSSLDIDWSKFPVKEMISRGWVNKVELDTKKTIEEIVHGFVSQIGWNLSDAAFKRTLSGNAYSPITKYSLFAWLARVIQKARKQKDCLGEFNESYLSADFLKNLAQLSWFDNGPLLAIEFLQKHGIAIVIEPQLKGTKIDGAALRDINGVPVIGLTIRHDRLDNFWFTLIHEAAHIWKHIGKEGNETFLDDLDVTSEDRREAEANRLAREAFIPNIIWKRSEAFLSPSKMTIDNLSRELKITPAIIAGRLRRESNNYRQFSELVGYGEVSRILKDYINK